MRKLVYQPWMSMDGYAADANKTTKFFEDRKYGVESDEDIFHDMDDIDTIILGANTYKTFIDYWPSATSDTEIIADRLNNTPKIIFSESMQQAPWGDYPPAKIINTDAVTAIKQLKKESGKNMVMWGSISLAKSLMHENLIDEFHIRIVPVAIGAGLPLFNNKEEKKFNLFDSKMYSSGMMLLKYRPD